MLYDLDNVEIPEFYEQDQKLYKNYKVTKLYSKSLIESSYENNDRNISYLFIPLGSSFDRVIILLHGMGKRNFKHLEYFGHRFAKVGIPVLMPVLPFHGERKIEGFKEGEKFLTDDIEESIRDYRQAILDIRATLNYLQEKGFGKKGFTLMGFSFGGIVGTILMGVDERIKNGMLVVTGGNYEYITWKSIATQAIRKKYQTYKNYESFGCTYEKCREIHNGFKEIIKTIKEKDDVEKLNFKMKCFLFDPLTFAPLINGRDVIIVRAIFDEIFPKESTLELKEVIGTAELVNLISDHYLVILYRRFLFNYAYNLVREV